MSLPIEHMIRSASRLIFGAGRDTIEDFGAGDVIMLAAGLGLGSFGEVLALATSVGGGDDTLLNFGGGNSLRLEDVRLSELVASDFLFA